LGERGTRRKMERRTGAPGNVKEMGGHSDVRKRAQNLTPTRIGKNPTSSRSRKLGKGLKGPRLLGGYDTKFARNEEVTSFV